MKFFVIILFFFNFHCAQESKRSKFLKISNEKTSALTKHLNRKKNPLSLHILKELDDQTWIQIGASDLQKSLIENPEQLEKSLKEMKEDELLKELQKKTEHGQTLLHILLSKQIIFKETKKAETNQLKIKYHFIDEKKSEKFIQILLERFKLMDLNLVQEVLSLKDMMSLLDKDLLSENSALHLAYLFKHEGAFDAFLEFSPDLLIQNGDGNSLFHLAMKDKNTLVLKKLFSQLPDSSVFDIENSEGKRFIEYMIDVDLFQVNTDNQMPPHMIKVKTLKNTPLDLIKLFQKRILEDVKVSLEYEEREDLNLLHIAMLDMALGKSKALKKAEFLAKQINPNLKDAKGDTPFHLYLKFNQKIDQTSWDQFKKFKFTDDLSPNQDSLFQFSNIDDQNQTLLHIAVEKSYPQKFIDALSSKGPSQKKIEDFNGKMPFDLQ